MNRNRPDIRITPSFCIALAVASVWDRSGLFSCTVTAIALHESGHLLAMLLCKCPVYTLSFRAFGIEILAEMPAGRKRAWIMVAGPLSNILTALFLLPFYTTASAFLQNLCTCSLLLGTFHLLPLRGFDGGAALLALTEERRGVRTLCNILTGVAVGFFAITGLYLVVVSRNPSLLVLAVYLFLNFLFGKTKSV